jgi:hypothetical protein
MFPVADPYVTYAEFKNYRSPDNTISDSSLVEELLTRASRTYESNCSRTFLPFKETRYYDYQSGTSLGLDYSGGGDQYPYFPSQYSSSAYYDPRVLKVGDDLVEVIELKTANGDTTIASDEYFLMCGTSYNVQPYDRIMLDETTGILFDVGNSYQRANELTALWGYHEDWANAWLQVDTLDANINDAVTTFTTTGSYTFEWGQLLKINDEYMLVTTAATPVVVRGKRGTTAAAHEAGDAIFVFQPHTDIVQAVLRLTDFLYTQKDSKDGTTNRDIVTATGVILRPASLPRDIRDSIAFYTMDISGVFDL